MALSIRFAGVEDAVTLHRFIVALAEYEKEPEAVEVTPAVLAAQMRSARPPFECLLAERDGRAVGLALFFQSYSTWRGRPGLYLEDLFVDESERRAGVGRALLVRLAQVAVERECGRLEWAVLDWNEPAIGFYRSLGAVAQEEWTVHRLADGALRALAGVAPDGIEPGR